MLTAALATLSAALFGGADFLGGLASRKDSALPSTILAQAVGLAVLTTIALTVWRPSGPLGPAALLGVAAGVSGGIGVVSLYAGLATGRMSVVAPITAALSGSIPAAVGLLRGEELPATALLGMALALVAVVVVSAAEHDEGSGPASRAIAYALVAGAGFSGSILAYSMTPQASATFPLAIARATTVIMLASAALLGRRALMPTVGARPVAAWAGALDASANVALVIALRIGPLSVASVLGALYPVATVLLARFVLHEHLRGMQRLGIALALVAVVLTAVR